ncbi:rhomboid family intramembrane serine protease [Henriciella litoralis]|uniref:rhomboid family intramembrane serine protease n=1 Tax=Henriciella litoralis TaxID=568102 RepID=UPI0009FDA3DA|nr:rhomboid family intramembrane serine protease [Henriciella litoralis]
MENFYAFPATMVLIAINVLVSIAGWLNPQFLVSNLFHVAPIREKREYHRLITSGFLHGGVFHLLINMFVLFQFGRFIEYELGTPRFLIVYFAALLGGNLWALMENFRSPDYRALGASGATSGIILSFCLFQPFAMLIFFIIPMPAVVFAVLFIGISVFLAQRENRVIGHEAHIGGAVAGLIATIAVAPYSLSVFSQQISAFLSGG